jgi:S1-C subfamily serine protease
MGTAYIFFGLALAKASRATLWVGLNMMRLATLLVSIFGASIVSTSVLAKPYGSIKVGGWQGGAYADDKTGAFTHCAAGSTYRSGIYVVLSQDEDYSWTLGFANEGFHLTTGETFPIDVTFDGQGQFHLFGKAVSSELEAAALPFNALTQFRKSRTMEVEAKGLTTEFALTATDRLASTIANCVAKVKANGLSNAGDFSISVAKPVAQSPVSATSTPDANKTTQQDGTGFLVSTSGHIVTNYHVIDGCVGDIKGNLTGEGTINLRIVSTDETNDLALLQAQKTFNDVATIRGSAIHPGDTIIAIGYPLHGLLTSDFTVSAGIVSSLSGLLNDTRYLQISAGVQSGNSGGPLLDTSGNVVGVVAAKINAIKFAKATGDLPQNINFAVKTGAMRDFLDNSAVSYQTSESKVELKTAEIASKARAYTLLISCTAKAKD